MGGGFLILLAGPVVMGVIGYLSVRPVTSRQGLVATGLSMLFAVGVLWFGLRHDESAVEALLSLGLVAGSALGVIDARRRAAKSRQPATDRQL